MPALVVNAGFFIMLTNPYELAHEAFRDRSLRDKRAELSRMVFNTGALRFVRFQISNFLVRRVTPDPHMSGECELCEVITSFGATAGTLLRQFSTNNNKYPNALEIGFTRRSPRNQSRAISGPDNVLFNSLNHAK